MLIQGISGPNLGQNGDQNPWKNVKNVILVNIFRVFEKELVIM